MHLSWRSQVALLSIRMCVANHGHQCGAAHWEGHLVNKCQHKMQQVRSFIDPSKYSQNKYVFCCVSFLWANYSNKVGLVSCRYQIYSFAVCVDRKTLADYRARQIYNEGLCSSTFYNPPCVLSLCISMSPTNARLQELANGTSKFHLAPRPRFLDPEDEITAFQPQQTRWEEEDLTVAAWVSG